MKGLFNRAKNGIRNLGMAKKICIVFTLILLITVIVTYLITYCAYSNSIEKTTKDVMEETAKTMAVSLDNTIQIAKQITIAPLFSTELQESFKAGNKVDALQKKDSRFFMTFLNSMPLSSHSVIFYAQDGSIIFSRIPNAFYHNYEENYLNWKQASSPYKGTAIVMSTDSHEDYPCVVLRSVIDTENFEDIGMAAVCISKIDFKHSLQRINNIPGGRAVVLDYNDKVIYDSEGRLSATSECGEDIMELSRQSGRYSTKIGDEIYEGVNVIRHDDMYKILVFSTRNMLLADMKSTQKLLIFIVVGVCLLAFVIVFLSSKYITDPLRKITLLMRKVQQGDFSVRFHSQSSDEIGVLGDNFDLLLEKLNEQIEDIVAITSNKKQLEIDILRSQINPHFMYNTMETIHMMAIDADEPQIEDISKVFGRIMRYNITALNEMTTLGRELTYLSDYMYIQNTRFKGRYTLENRVDEGLKDVRMMKMLLQPIVENAMIHGLEVTGKKGNICINAIDKEEDILITVEDNGEGITADRLDEIRKRIDETEDHGDSNSIGLRNINCRIKLFYGDKYGLCINSEVGKGTTVGILIPKKGESNDKDSLG